MTDAVRPAAAAVSFLTRVPVGRVVRVGAGDIARGAWLFPVVGGVVGGACGLLADVSADWLPALAAGALAVGTSALLTGAMHLDGLADTADSLGGSSRERALEIMRDHAVGTYGVTALIVVLTVEAASLGALAETDHAALVGLAAGAAGRAAILPPALALQYVRAEGHGSVLEDLRGPTVAVGLAVGLVLCLPAGAAGLWAAGAAALAALVLSLFARHRFGGVTGDVLGAIAALSEAAALIAGAAALT